MRDQTSRRNFLQQVSLAAGTAAVLQTKSARSESSSAPNLQIASNQYSWFVYFQRENRDFAKSMDEGFGEVKECGLAGFEPNVSAPQNIDEMAPIIKKHGLQMYSLYVNSTLHTREDAQKSIENILAIAEKAKPYGTKIFVTNPNPIQWGGQENKNDEQLAFQAESLDTLGKKLKEKDMILAIHNHDIELRNAAREFHHMMVGTNPDYVTLCLDAHWIYRGSGNSSIALFDVLSLYGKRVSELHLRQSTNNIWSEVFGEGDIDYARLAKQIKQLGIKPHLVLEQACEKGTPNTMNTKAVHQKSTEYVKKIFG